MLQDLKVNLHAQNQMLLYQCMNYDCERINKTITELVSDLALIVKLKKYLFHFYDTVC